MKLPWLVESGQWWRLISSMFVHLDVAHIVFNGYGLYAIGPIIERFYGRARMFAIYMVSGLLAMWASQVMSDVPSGGASGALYGLVGAMLAFGFKYRRQLPERFSRALTTGMLPWVVFGIGIGFLEFVPFDNSAHIGGLIGGAAVAWVMRSRVARGPGPVWGERVVGAVAGACVVALVVSFMFWAVEVAQCTGSVDALDMCYPELFRGR
jgi:membrane associated rhomboid family serine protease